MFTLLNNFLRIQSAGILGFVLPDRGKSGVNPASHRARSHELNKVYVNASQAISDIVRDGQLIAVGGFGLCCVPEALIEAVRESGVRHLTLKNSGQGAQAFRPS
nr:MAG TPA: Acyl CoA:acetate/3-ketoacid CoA transferase, alpha subunit [Inoviridae sp.]